MADPLKGNMHAFWAASRLGWTGLMCVCVLLIATDARAASRTISFYNIHTKEHLTVTYRRNGRFVAAAMDKINWFLRDWRKNEKTDMDPEVIDLAWEIHTELGSREPIHVISGYRSPKTNAHLRRTRGGQAKRSQHMHGRALDLHFPDVPVRRIRYSGLIRERGGVGYYPTSALPFVHIDTARVRHWPRMRRQELALLFPSGRTRHRPARGGPITPADAIAARRQHPALYRKIAMFRAARQPLDGRPRTLLASLPPQPRQPILPPFETRIRPPRPMLAQRPPVLQGAPQPAVYRSTAPTLASRHARTPGANVDRNSMARLAARASLAAWATTPPPGADDQPPGQRRPSSSTPNVEEVWTNAPAYDDEHPEELSYAPFPIASLLSDNPDGSHPILTRLAHPDPSRTIELLDDAETWPSLTLHPGRQVVRMKTAQTFNGRAVALEALLAARRRQRDAVPPGSGNGGDQHRRDRGAEPLLTAMR